MKTASTTVTVVIPVYNVAPYVERCLLSVMQQTFPAAECIIVDDCSTDDSIAICNRLIRDYNGTTRFSILQHERNRGLSAVRNTGTKAATGEYIYYLDSDDEITSDCLKRLIEPLRSNNSLDMVMGEYQTNLSAISKLGGQL